MTKRCSKCKIKQSIDSFYKDKFNKDGFRNRCKDCIKKESKQRYLDNPEYQKNYKKTDKYKNSKRKHDLKHKYDITPRGYNDILESQNNKCAICGTKDSGGKGCFHIDHSHNSGKIRGLLCYKCNTILGYANDNTSILLNAVEYLRNEK